MNQLAVLEKMSPLEIYGPENIDKVLKAIEKEAREKSLDISTDPGRKEVASVAHKIARSKTFIDDCGKKLGEEAKAKVDAINAERKKARDFLDGLKDDIRKPLTQWEEKEKFRVEELNNSVNAIIAAQRVGLEESSAEIEKKIQYYSNIERNWDEFEAKAVEAIAATVAHLNMLLKEKKDRESQAAELAKYRAMEAERAQKERDALIAKEAADKAIMEAEIKAHAEKVRVEREKKVAEEKLAAVEREKALAEKRAAEEAEAAKIRQQLAVENERKKIAAEKKAEEDAAAKREADHKHKAKVNNQILDAMVASGLTKEQGVTLITAIATGKVPFTRIQY